MSEPKPNGNQLIPLLVWVTKGLAVLYAVILIIGIGLTAFTDAGLDPSILASITAVATTALGGLITTVIRMIRRK